MWTLGRVTWGLGIAAGFALAGCGKSTRDPLPLEMPRAGAGPGHGGETGVVVGEGGTSGSEPSSCNVPPAKMFESRIFGPHSDHFAGMALVERSTEGDLLLAFDLSGYGMGEPAVAGAHLKLTGLSAMPRIAPGLPLWLELDAPPSTGEDFGPPSASSFSVYDEQLGTLLLGRSSTNSFDSETAAAPLKVVGVQARCSEHNESCDSPAATREWRAVEVEADANVELEPGISTKVDLQGVSYDALGLAFGESTGDGFCAADYRPFSTINVNVLAADPEALTSKIPVFGLPACSVHNDRESSAGFSLLGVGLGTDYAGPAVYRRTADRDGLTEHYFDTPELAVQFPDSQPSLALSDGSKDFEPPAAGSELYFESHGYQAGALFSEKGGRPVFVSTIMLEPFDQDTLEVLSGWLGVSVVLQKTCDYAAALPYPRELPLALWQLALGAEPAVTVHTGERVPVMIGGQKYEAYVGGLEAMSFILRALDPP